MDDLILADLVGLSHGLIVLFIVSGQLLVLLGWCFSWGWTRKLFFRSLHLAAIGFVVLEVWLDIPCPLTLIEADLRGTGHEVSFIGYWLGRLLYFQAPGWVFTTLYSLFGGLAFFTFSTRRSDNYPLIVFSSDEVEVTWQMQ